MNTNLLYLDICATYHSTSVYWYLKNIQKSRTVLYGHCNTGTTLTDKKGYYGMFGMWLNKKRIVKLYVHNSPEEYLIVLHVTCNANG